MPPTRFYIPLTVQTVLIRVLLIQGADGNFYGTANTGGTSTNRKGGCGVVYKITPEGSFSVLYNLDLTNGANPSPLIQSADTNSYGTAYASGTSASCTGGCGGLSLR